MTWRVFGLVIVTAGLTAGCSGDPNSGQDTDIAKAPLPKGVTSDAPVNKPFKTKNAKSGSPELPHG